jgi:hypothetical protein
MKKQKNIPELRFPEFNEDWEITKQFKEVVKINQGLQIPCDSSEKMTLKK